MIRSAGRLLLPAYLLLCFACSPQKTEAPSTANSGEVVAATVLTSAGEVARAIQNGDVGHPVRLEGTVTYLDEYWRLFYVQDSTGAFFVVPPVMPEGIGTGDRIRIEGLTGVRESGVVDLQINRLGEVNLPAAPNVPVSRLAEHLAKLVQVEGVVEEARVREGMFTLRIIDGDHAALVRLRQYEVRDNLVLPGRRIRVSGVVMEAGWIADEPAPFQLLVARESRLAIVDDAEVPEVTENLPLITRIADLRSMPPAEAERRYPVKVEGVVTYFDPNWLLLFVQDESGGTFVQLMDAGTFSAGDRVSVEGWSGPGGFAPEIDKPSVTVLGRSPMPNRAARSLDRMFTGQEDGQWADVVAVVQDVTRDEHGHVNLAVASGFRHFTVQIPGLKDLPPPDSLVDARIRVRGVCGAVFNNKGQLTGITLFVPAMDYISIVRPGLDDPFDRKIQPVDHLLRFMPGGEVEHRARITGVVTLARPGGNIFVQDAGGAIYIQTVDRETDLHPGDEVDVVGFITPGGYTPSLSKAIYRVTGSRPLPPSQAITPEEALDGAFDARRVEIDALLISREETSIDYILTMQADDLLFKSYLPKRAFDADFVSELDPGTRLHLTGIFSAQVNSSMSSVSFSSFRLLLNDQHDVSVLARPSWWTTGRLVMGLGGFFGLTLLAFGWVTMLRRRVRLQTEIIEEKLQREAELKEIAETSSRAKTEFLADMSHEIRTPMNGIIGMAAILERTQLSSEQRQHLGIITSSASSLLTILNDVLDLSKVEAGKLQLEEIEFDLEKLVSNAARSLAPAAHGKDLELVCRIAPNVPRLLTGDQNRLRQVLVNLVGNAIKFTESGEVLIDVEAETSLPNVELHVKVVDTGLGIPREKQELIFNAFEQADLSTTRRFGGTGLGLVISRRLVEVMGGRMWLDSEPGRGSTFHFTARLTGRTRAVEVLPDLSVLIVVDHSTTRDVLEEIIRSWRMDPISVSGGHAAARAIEASPRISLVLLDQDMPGMNGLETAQAIRKLRSSEEVKIILLKSGSGGDLEATWDDLSVAASILKPFTEADLRKAVRSALQIEGRQAGNAPPQAPERNVPSLKILLVEDNDVNQKVALHLLKGHTVTVVSNGQDAVEACRENRFDVVLMDIQMPGMNGLEATAAIRQMESDCRTPIIAMTARIILQDRVACVEAGMDGYIAKPFDPKAMFSEIARVVGVGSEKDSTEGGLDRLSGDGRAGHEPASPVAAQVRESVSFDSNHLQRLIGGDNETIHGFLARFAASLPEEIASFREAHGRGDLAQIAESAHALLSAAGHLGFNRMHEALVHLEARAENGSGDGIPELLDILDEELSWMEREGLGTR